MRIRVQIDRRNDGDYTATVKLVAWPLNRLRGFIQNVSLVPFGRDIARELGGALLEALPQPEVEGSADGSRVEVEGDTVTGDGTGEPLPPIEETTDD